MTCEFLHYTEIVTLLRIKRKEAITVMKIRSITCFINPQYPLNVDDVSSVGEITRLAVEKFWNAGYEVQTTRLATPPFPQIYTDLSPQQTITAIQELEQVAETEGFNYVAVGPALIDKPESYKLIPEIIAGTEKVFCSAEMATRQAGVSLAAVNASAEIITRLAPLDRNGFSNLYFTALSNVGPGSPYFPAAYHDGGQPTFALALEAASLAVLAFERASSLNDGLARLRSLVEEHAHKLSAIGEAIQAENGLTFTGIDFSLAPFPERDASLGTAFEIIGVPRVGQHGSLGVAAILAATLDQADIPRVGFTGLLFPQLEDSVLAQRASEGSLTIKDLLMYSAVCGTGLDTIPLPGETTKLEIAALLFDLAALGLRLDKPLTARLMPIPGKQAGDPTDFDFDYFANSRVMSLDSSGLISFLRIEDQVEILPLRRHPSA
jgi:uncharacterized protein (UPF0210 family)